MKRRWSAWCGVLALALAMSVFSVTTYAANISGRSSTVVEWFDNPDGDTALPVYEYLLFNARDLWGDWKFHGYGRLGEDLADEVDIDSRLYTAYLSNNRLTPGLDLRIGRQFVSTSAGASVVDGVDTSYKFARHYTVRGIAGLGVSHNATTYHSDDYFLALEVETDVFEDLIAGLSYVQTWDQGDLAKEMLGFHADYIVSPHLHFYDETQYSLLYKEITYQLIGASGSWAKNWRGRFEYLYSLPVFDSTSIYSVFAVAEYEELLAEIDYLISPTHRSYLRYTHEIYEEFSNANVIDIGLESINFAPYRYYLSGLLRMDGDGQDMYGIKGYVGYQLTPEIESGLGAHVDVLDRRLENDEETTSSRIWIDGTYRISARMSLQGKVEYIESDLWDEYYRGRVRFNILF